jgi:apolipoprotein D and lipocalin family protein
MKLIYSIIILVFCLTNVSMAQEPDTVSQLDIPSYMGKWYELASIPQSFQRDCLKNTTADYSLEGDEIKVINSCDREDGTRKSSEGRARLNPDFTSPSKLEVTFVNFLGWQWMFAGNYWVLDLDTQYQWSIVGDPNLEYLWILSRTPQLSKEKLILLREKIKSIGYDTCEILLSITDSNGLDKRRPLCDL